MSWPLAVVILGAFVLVGFVFHRATESDIDPDPTQGTPSRWESYPDDVEDE